MYKVLQHRVSQIQKIFITNNISHLYTITLANAINNTHTYEIKSTWVFRSYTQGLKEIKLVCKNEYLQYPTCEVQASY